MHRTLEELEAGLDVIRAAPSDRGAVSLIVRRPAEGERETLDAAELDPDVGLVGDNWKARGNRYTPDGTAKLEQQLTIMGARAAELMAGPMDRWALAGDQLFVDYDLSEQHIPAGSRLRVGDAILEVTASPHLGCAKFAGRYGRDALRFVNSEDGRALRVRGVNARVIEGGTVSVGSFIQRESAKPVAPQ